jgi:hypothetical protein
LLFARSRLRLCGADGGSAPAATAKINGKTNSKVKTLA